MQESVVTRVNPLREAGMRVAIVGERIRVRDGLRDFIERRLWFALGRFSPEIDHVTARVGDVNGPNRGGGKHCRIVVKLKGLENVMKEVVADDLEFAVCSAADRVGRSVARALERRRDRRRRPGVSMAGEQNAGRNGTPGSPAPGDDASRKSKCGHPLLHGQSDEGVRD